MWFGDSLALALSTTPLPPSRPKHTRTHHTHACTRTHAHPHTPCTHAHTHTHTRTESNAQTHTHTHTHARRKCIASYRAGGQYAVAALTRLAASCPLGREKPWRRCRAHMCLLTVCLSVCLFVCFLCVCVQVGDKPLSADDFWKSVQEDIALAASKDLQARRVLTVPTEGTTASAGLRCAHCDQRPAFKRRIGLGLTPVHICAGTGARPCPHPHRDGGSTQP